MKKLSKNSGFTFNSSADKGFTLIELLIAIAIIGILITLSSFAITQAQKSARNSRRKADLETIRSGLELYRSDCGEYPAAFSDQVPDPLVGSGLSASCAASNTYLKATPSDPQSVSGKIYRYARVTAFTYELCSNLEGFSAAEAVTCGGIQTCGSASDPCHYQVTSP